MLVITWCYGARIYANPCSPVWQLYYMQISSDNLTLKIIFLGVYKNFFAECTQRLQLPEIL